MKTEPIWKIEQSEAEFQSAVMQLATSMGWDWMHIRPGMNERGFYRTPVSGALGSGWPDMVLLKDGRLIFAELKSEKGRVTQIQKTVMAKLMTTGISVYLWRPSDWEKIVKVLGYHGPVTGPLQERGTA